MKTLQNILIIVISLNFTISSQSPLEKKVEKGAFVKYEINNNSSNTNKWDNLFGEKDEIKDKSMPVIISNDFIDKVLEKKEEKLHIDVPFFENELFDIELTKKEIDLSDFKLIVREEFGPIEKKYNPGFIVYEISGNDLGGIMIFSKSGLSGVINKSDNIYEISKLDEKRSLEINQDLYIISDISNNLQSSKFTCGVDNLSQIQTDHVHNHHNTHRTGSALSCMNVAIEIDYFTSQTFDSVDESIDWALSILAGVSEIYEEELNLKITSNYAYVWNTVDPYNSYIEQSSEMLYAIKDKWNTEEDLLEVDRHIVHLFTKRQNTGTGGIAFVNGAGSQSYGFGYSSNLTSNMDYFEVPEPFYHWNLLCTAHEIGHNLGSMHTQWCGWPGGPINNCVDLEESTPGECDSFVNNPTPQVGTIMSYCHTWSQNEGGGIIMKFDPLVQEVMLSKANSLSLPICDDSNIEVIFGCLDEEACNYNNQATQNDDTCFYSELYYDCDGHCILDTDQDGVCDELDNCPDNWNADQVDYNSNGIGDRCEYLLPLEEMKNVDLLMAYPNPTTGVINITYNSDQSKDFSLEIYNILGDRIACGYPDLYGREVTASIDLSERPKGVYTIVVKTKDNIISKPIILK